MNCKIGFIELDSENINLDVESIENLKQYLKKINSQKDTEQKELDEIIKSLN